MNVPNPQTIRDELERHEEYDLITERPIAHLASGCLYAFYIVALSGFMLFFNALVCLAVYSTIPKMAEEQIMSRIGQLIFFTLPLIMLLVEWHLLDRVQRLFRRNQA